MNLIISQYLPLPIASIIEQYEISEILLEMKADGKKMYYRETPEFFNDVLSIIILDINKFRRFEKLIKGEYDKILNISFVLKERFKYTIHTREELIQFKCVFPNGISSSYTNLYELSLLSVAENYYIDEFEIFNKQEDDPNIIADVMDLFMSMADIVTEACKTNEMNNPMIKNLISDVIDMINNDRYISNKNYYSLLFNDLIKSLRTFIKDKT